MFINAMQSLQRCARKTVTAGSKTIPPITRFRLVSSAKVLAQEPQKESENARTTHFGFETVNEAAKEGRGKYGYCQVIYVLSYLSRSCVLLGRLFI